MILFLTAFWNFGLVVEWQFDAWLQKQAATADLLLCSPPPVPDTPVEVLVELLTKAKGLAATCAAVPEELKSHLQKALDIASGLDDYLEKITTKESEPLAELYE